MQPPDGIANVPSWEENCRRIHARAKDFLEGRIGAIEAARALAPLAFWTQTESDPDLLLFRAIDSETDTLPTGPVRTYWAEEALDRKDAEIKAAEDHWRADAMAAAAGLVERYGWALEARRRRSASGDSPDERPATKHLPERENGA